MIEVSQTSTFADWFAGLRDMRARARIQTRIDRLQLGLMGDVKYFEGIGEVRIDHGPGYRLYFVQRGGVVIILLCGGDKSTQRADIARAHTLARDLP